MGVFSSFPISQPIICEQRNAIVPNPHKLNCKCEPLSSVVGHKFKSIGVPLRVDLSAKFGEVFDQGALGSCTGQALVELYDFESAQNDVEKEPFIGSRLFVYYNERMMDQASDSQNEIDNDAGSTITEGILSLSKYGVCRESYHPYDITQFKTCPSAQAYKNALHHRAMKYEHVEQSQLNLKMCLSQGYPMALGIQVYDSFMSPEVNRTGIVPMPNGTDTVRGGHAVCLIGYDDNTQTWKLRNSWGKSWGDKGNFTLPYDYLTNENLCSDIWKIVSVQDENDENDENKVDIACQTE